MRSRTAARRPWRSAAALAALACLSVALVVLPAGASAASRGPLPGGRTTLGPAAPGGFPDTVIHRRARLLRAGDAASRDAIFPVFGGQQVRMSTSFYSDAEMQGIANVLGGLVHGAEMNSLSVYVATPDEITYICGQGALACYAPGISEMIVSGQDGSTYGVPRDYTIAHEYGHHIANNQLNSPWTALDTGAKRWATYTHVCQGVRKGQLFPGDESSHYWDNPGEAFAETNAHLNFPEVSVPWGYSALLRPTPASTQKLRADILSPWSQQATVSWNGSLWRQRHNPAERRFATPLDGMVQIKLDGPADANYDVFILGPKLHLRKQDRRRKGHRKARVRRRVIERGVSAGSSEQLDLQLCGQSSIRVEVRRRSGEGPFTVSVTRP